MSNCSLVVTQNKILLEMNYIYENFETKTDFRNDNKLKFDQFEFKE